MGGPGAPGPALMSLTLLDCCPLWKMLCVCMCVAVGQNQSNVGSFIWFKLPDHPLQALASGLRIIPCQATVTVRNTLAMPLFFQTNHCFLRSGIQINKNPHQKGKPTAASRSPPRSLASLPGHLLSLMLEGERQKGEPWLLVGCAGQVGLH